MKKWRGVTSALYWGEWSTPSLDSFTRRKETRYAVVHEGGWAAGPVWTGTENLAPTNICKHVKRAKIAVASSLQR
jgi:hypothetical protein